MPRDWQHAYGDWALREYRPTFFASSDNAFINERHRTLVEILQDVEGKLERVDYHKLYEVAYFAAGPVLEIGRLHAKSTAIIAMALLDAGHPYPFYSVDLAPQLILGADRNLAAHGVRDRVILIQGDSASVVGQLPGQFDVAFVDGDHSYQGVTADIFALRGRIVPGGAVLFHDYYHGANAEPENLGMKVAYAVDKHTPGSRLAFRGGNGAIALYEQT